MQPTGVIPSRLLSILRGVQIRGSLLICINIAVLWNSYGHPDKETVKRLEDADVQVEYTMKHGAIIYKVVGNTVFAEHYVNEQ